MAELTTDRKSGGRSRLSPHASDRERQKPPRPRTAAQESEERTAAALALVYRSILPRLNHHGFRASNGFTSPSYNRALTHTEDLFRDLALDLGVEWTSLSDSLQQSDASVRRVVREYMEEAGVELEAYVASLPRPVSEVLVLKSVGLSWRRVMEALPHRVHYSVMDDWRAGLARVWREREDLVRRLV